MITPEYVYRIWGGKVPLEEIEQNMVNVILPKIFQQVTLQRIEEREIVGQKGFALKLNPHSESRFTLLAPKVAFSHKYRS